MDIKGNIKIIIPTLKAIYTEFAGVWFLIIFGWALFITLLSVAHSYHTNWGLTIATTVIIYCMGVYINLGK